MKIIDFMLYPPTLKMIREKNHSMRRQKLFLIGPWKTGLNIIRSLDILRQKEFFKNRKHFLIYNFSMRILWNVVVNQLLVQFSLEKEKVMEAVSLQEVFEKPIKLEPIQSGIKNQMFFWEKKIMSFIFHLY